MKSDEDLMAEAMLLLFYWWVPPIPSDPLPPPKKYRNHKCRSCKMWFNREETDPDASIPYCNRCLKASRERKK